jgi:putative salt-induced outer membrane protein
LTRGNSHQLLYSGDLETAKKTPENEYNLGVGGTFGSQDSKDTVNNYGAFGQWNHLFTERFYSYVRAEAKRDIIADLDYRFNVGPGAGYYLVKMTNTTLAVEAGPGYQYEHLGDEYNSFATLRLAEKLEHKFNDRARVWQKVELLPQVDEFDNYLINFEVGAEASLTTVLSLKTTLEDAYQSQPAAGRDENDIRIISRISYKF